ncbi:hypothetical protein [Streptomyces qinzhouensis]|uniref:Uncharacterized protein n=1 Tax=Streptomyces qinzhouensis TaxID=2599401 RepID=A0A5B8IDK5_9ACTN|nr:hypothetical protein [Streptomyces qinzhouensis]QDY76142.1 hypothetical protein FQU76_05955 [Streptomyces qinzhouensis]
MNIDWEALGSVFGVSLVATVGLVGLFSLGVIALTKQDAAAAKGGSTVLPRTGAYACFTACALAVSYGIYLIIV